MANDVLTLTAAETRADVTKWKATSVTLNVEALVCHIHYQKCLADDTPVESAKTVHTMSQANMDALMATIVTSDKDSADPDSAPSGTVV